MEPRCETILMPTGVTRGIGWTLSIAVYALVNGAVLFGALRAQGPEYFAWLATGSTGVTAGLLPLLWRGRPATEQELAWWRRAPPKPAVTAALSVLSLGLVYSFLEIAPRAERDHALLYLSLCSALIAVEAWRTRMFSRVPSLRQRQYLAAAGVGSAGLAGAWLGLAGAPTLASLFGYWMLMNACVSWAGPSRAPAEARHAG